MNLEIQQRKKISILPWLMLTSRLILFTFFQACFALGFYIAKAGDPWSLSLLYWPLGVISANLCCLVFLFLYYRSQGVSYFEYFKFQRESIKKDVLLMIALFFLSIILSMAPNIGLATILFGNPQAGMEMMDHGIPLWVKLFSLPLLPITQMFAEIPIYMVYCAPELQKQGLKS